MTSRSFVTQSIHKGARRLRLRVTRRSIASWMGRPGRRLFIPATTQQEARFSMGLPGVSVFQQVTGLKPTALYTFEGHRSQRSSYTYIPKSEPAPQPLDDDQPVCTGCGATTSPLGAWTINMTIDSTTCRHATTWTCASCVHKLNAIDI